MKNLKLLNKVYLINIFIFLIFSFSAKSEDPVDIWNVEKKEKKQDVTVIEKLEEKNITQNNIYEMQSQKINQQSIEEDQTLISQKIEVVGLYDPAQNGLNISMWNNSDGSKILHLINNINKIDLSKDASEIFEILLLTNTYYPQKNISKEQFLEIKSNWLIKNSNLKLIEEYLINNQLINENSKLTKYLVDDYLSRSQVEKSCEIFSKIKQNIEDEYLSNFKIYCLVNNNKSEEAQLLIDLKKELGFKNKFFEQKISYLLGYQNTPETTISEKTILDFHLSHRTNPAFKFEPKNSTSKQIWKYLSTSNLLDGMKDVDISDINKILTIERATHEKNFSEKELYEIYKKFQFNIDQFLNIKESTKVLSDIETRALVYQGILITTEVEKKLELMNALKNSFINDGLENAFSQELTKFLKEMDADEIPSNYTTFYKKNINTNEVKLKNIKINNKIFHQSKLVNYFKDDYPNKNITKDLNDLLKKIKRNKKYFFSKKDVILIEALKSDGIKVSERYKNLYEVNKAEIPTDIQNFINDSAMGLAMLRIVEVIGQDQLEDIDVDTMYFIISTLNQLNITPLRNKILLKVLPLKI